MGKRKKSENKKKLKGAEKTALKTAKKLDAKQKQMLEKLGEANIEEVLKIMEQEEARLKTVTETCCSPPTPRSSCTLIAHPEKDELILFGGEFFNGKRRCVYNDLYFYNIAKNEWKQLRSPSGPTPRSGHQMVSVASNEGELWLFGGEFASPSELQFYHYKDLWVFRLAEKKWSKVSAPNGPNARSGHRMVASKKRLIVFGGFIDFNHTYHYYNDVYMFSLENYEWRNIKVSDPIVPKPRSGCCMAACSNGTILVWGGYSKEETKGVDRGITHTDMFALIRDESHPDDKAKWSTVKAGGYKPLPRSGVGCTTAPNGKAYCFGGVMDINEDEDDVQGQFSDDLLSLDLESHKWRLLEIGAKKSGGAKKTDNSSTSKDVEMQNNESSTTVSSDGIFTITVAGSTAGPVLPEIPSLFPNKRPKSVPPPRMNAALCAFQGTLYIYGGIYEENDKQYTFNDFYALDLKKLDEWKVIIPNDMNAHDWIDDESSGDSDSEEDSKKSDDDDEDDTDDSDMDTD